MVESVLLRVVLLVLDLPLSMPTLLLDNWAAAKMSASISFQCVVRGR